MSAISQKIVGLEQIANGAIVPWLSRMKALGAAHPDVIEAASRELGAPAELAAKLKAAVGAEISEDVPGLSGSSAAVTAFISQMRTQSVLARIFAEKWASAVPLNHRLMSLGLDATAAVVGQGMPIPVQGLPWNDPVIVSAEKIAAALILTNELWRDASAAGQNFVNTQLRAAIAAASDRFLFAKLINGGTSEIGVETFGGRPLSDALRTALLATLNAVHTRAAGRLVWAVSPQAANMLATEEDDKLNPFTGTIAAIPAVISGGLTGSRLGLIDAAAIGGNVERLEITSTDDATIEMADDPANDTMTPTGSTNMVSLFQTNSTAVKYVLRLGLEPVRDSAAAFITFEEDES